tara:strand:- start:4999 stop:5199 length:201 start_codon:yes stop_codon:yes gene_type:complete
MTPAQKSVLDFIRSYIKKHEYSPILQEIADFRGVSVHAVYQNVNQLIERGFLTKQLGRNRSIRIVK